MKSYSLLHVIAQSSKKFDPRNVFQIVAPNKPSAFVSRRQFGAQCYDIHLTLNVNCLFRWFAYRLFDDFLSITIAM
jgi:hypothetical protein